MVVFNGMRLDMNDDRREIEDMARVEKVPYADNVYTGDV